MVLSRKQLMVGLVGRVSLDDAAWAVAAAWRAQGKSASGDATAPSTMAAAPAGKIIVSDQAQKNLGLTAKPLKAEVFWKRITVQGMVVDRPGVSDREIVAP